jgi:hypothetical protein
MVLVPEETLTEQAGDRERSRIPIRKVMIKSGLCTPESAEYFPEGHRVPADVPAEYTG